MKKFFYSFKSLPTAVSLILCGFLSGCYTSMPEEETISAIGNSKLSVVTRSNSNEKLHYPLSIYVFDEKGLCKAEKVINDESEAIKMNLSEGSYRVTAIAGYNGLVKPKDTNSTSAFTTNNGNYSISPLSLGHADVVISGSTSVTLQMGLQMASIEITLTEVPDDITDIKINIAKQYSKIDFDGIMSECRNTVITCTKVEDKWTTGKIYLLPSANESTILTISMTDITGTQNYGYTYNSPLKAGIPYILNGVFAKGITLNGTIVSSGWNEEVVLDFNFGPNVEETGVGGSQESGDSNSENEESIKVNEIPEVCSVWNGHVVALVENETNTSADVVLISLQEWKGYLGTDEGAEDALETAKNYIEGGISGWSIPSKEQATAIISLYAGNYVTDINDILESIDGYPIAAYDKSGDNHRYLCDDAKSSFSMGGSRKISNVGESTKYRLRLVKKLHLSL